MDSKFLDNGSDYIVQTPHPSMRTWTLLQDGSVQIPEIVIIYATHVEFGRDSQMTESEEQGAAPLQGGLDPAADLKVEFHGPEVGGPVDLFESTTSLRSWMDTRLTDIPKYAVYLSASRFCRESCLRNLLPLRALRPEFWLKWWIFSKETMEQGLMCRGRARSLNMRTPVTVHLPHHVHQPLPEHLLGRREGRKARVGGPIHGRRQRR